VNIDLARDYLIRLGYHVAYREQGWTECLLSHRDERWLGRGLSRVEALGDALRLAFPSHAAWHLLRQEAQRSGEARGVAAGPAAPDALDEARPRPARTYGWGVAAGSPVGSGPAPVEGAPSRAPDAPATSAPPPPAADRPAEDAAPDRGQQVWGAAIRETAWETPPSATAVWQKHAPPPAPAARVVAAPAPIVVARRAPTMSTEEAVEELAILRRNIEDDQDELGMVAPRRQRLVLLGWIASARAFEEMFPEEPRVFEEVAAVAKTLTSLCKAWWPGSVRALQLHVGPADIARELPSALRGASSTWGEAADLVREALAWVEEDDARRGLDADGWADADRLVPPPAGADEMVREICAEVERLGGPLGYLPATLELPPRQSSLDWARTLRWTRGAVFERRSWGLLAGRLRYWASRRRAGLEPVARTLDPAFRPDWSWNEVVGRVPEGRWRKAQLLEVFARAPAPEDAPDDERLLQWLAGALPWSDTHHGNIVLAMRPFRDRVLALDNESLPDADRQLRRRLARLKKDLDPAQRPDEARVQPAPVPTTAEIAEETASAGRELPVPAHTVGEVLASTRGRRALCAFLRPPPDGEAALATVLELAQLDCATVQDGALRALPARVAEGGYGLVLGAGGFHSHAVDRVLGGACRHAGIPYVRVSRGRLVQCVVALHRVLCEGATSGAASGESAA
jgi:hypothetical protein